MRLSLDPNDGSNLIRAYYDGAITVYGVLPSQNTEASDVLPSQNTRHEQTINHSIIVTPVALHDWPPVTFAELEEIHFEQIQQLQPEIVLLGTGARQQFPHPGLIHSLINTGIGVEVMNTPAACRTYNIICAEGRAVAAALLMI